MQYYGSKDRVQTPKDQVQSHQKQKDCANGKRKGQFNEKKSSKSSPQQKEQALAIKEIRELSKHINNYEHEDKRRR
eukprot:7597679-Ditylum_brightwellii.AAC.1